MSILRKDGRSGFEVVPCINPGCSHTYLLGQPYGRHTSLEGKEGGTCSKACEDAFTALMRRKQEEALRADSRWQGLMSAT